MGDKVSEGPEKRPEIAEWLGNLPLVRRHWRVFAVCSAGLMLDSIDIQVMGLLAPHIAREWSVGAELSAALFALTAAGMFIGAAASGPAADRWGRRPTMIAMLALFSAASLGCGLAIGPTGLLAFRFVAGIGLGAFLPVDTTYLAEILPTRRRGTLLGLWTVGLPLGNLAAIAMAAFLLPLGGWQLVLIVCAAPAVIIVILAMGLPESPVYLARSGRPQQAERAASWFGDGSANTFTIAAAPPAVRIRFGALLERRFRRRSVSLWVLWFAWNFSYFGAVLWIPTVLLLSQPAASTIAILAAMAVAGVAGRLSSAFVVDRLGRRRTVILCGSGAAIAALALSMAGNPLGIVIAAAALGFLQDGGASSVVTWTPELYPTDVRATAVGVANAVGRIGAVISPLVSGALIVFSPAAVFAAFAFVYGIGVMAAIFLTIETRDSQLDDLANAS